MNRQGPPPGSDNEETTILRPSPGWRRDQAQRPRPSASPTSGGGPADLEFDPGFKPASGLLTDGALSLLMVASKLRIVPYFNAIGELKERLDGQIKDFQNRSIQNGFSEQQARTASYFICSFVDETVLNTPLGSQSNWGHDSLLVRFHQETLGGEEFFQTVERMLQRPAQNLDLLELAYICLSLGFEGKYRFAKDGLRELEKLRTEIYLAIERNRGTLETGLSVHWEPLHDLRNPFTRRVPLWVLVTIAALLLLAVFLGLSYSLSKASDLVYNEWMLIAAEEVKPIPEQRVAFNFPVPSVPEKPLVAPEPARDWRTILASNISQNQVQVLDGPILRIRGAFPSGSDRIEDKYLPMLARITGELKKDRSQVEVIGYTDNKSIFSVRFPSNLSLSIARAKAVAGMLDASGSLKDRITFRGRG